MTNSLSDISVIICAYTEQRWQDLQDAVASVHNQNLAPRELIVVIDYNQALYERSVAAFPGAIIIQNTQPRGLSGARNTGIALAQGNIIAFLDDDAAALPDWLEQLSQGYDGPLVLGVGGSIEPVWAGGEPRWFPEEFYWVVGCTYRGMPLVAAPIRNMIGANMSFRREIFEAIGDFQNGMGRIGTLPMGCEETEICIRALKRWPARVFMYEPAARVKHRVPAARSQWRYFQSRCYSEGRSKVQVSRLVGAGAGLSTERSYTFKTLPQGVVRNIFEVILRRDPSGLSRAVAIIAGLATTVAGYASGTLSSKRLVRKRPSLEVVISETTPIL